MSFRKHSLGNSPARLLGVLLTPCRRPALQMITERRYRNGDPAVWGQGDFNGGPGGSAGKPPLGDGFFDEDDIMASLVTGLFGTGKYSPDPLRPSGVPDPASVVPFDENQGLVTIHYDAGTGEVNVTTPPGVTLSSILIELETTEQVFILDTSPFKGAFDFVSAQSLFVGSFNTARDSVEFGLAANTALLEDFWLSQLRVKGTLADSGPGPVTQVAFNYIAGRSSGLDKQESPPCWDPSPLTCCFSIFRTGLHHSSSRCCICA